MKFTLSRRALFQSGGALAVGGGTTQAAPRPASLKIGLATYSMRKKTLDEVIALCQATRVRYLSLKDMHLPRTAKPEELAATVAKIEAAGLVVAGGGVIKMTDDAEQVRRDFEYARAAKFPLIVASPSPAALDLVERMIAEFGIAVAIHNHGPEDVDWPAPRNILAAIKKRDRRLGVCMDIGHTVRAGADPVACVAECGPRLLDLHVKDLADKTNKNSQIAVGRGAIDVVGLFKALHKARFSGHVGLEYEINADDPAAGIRESFAYMRGLAAGLGA